MRGVATVPTSKAITPELTPFAPLPALCLLFAVARVGLGAAGLALSLSPAPGLFTVLWALFLAYGCIALFWKDLDRAAPALGLSMLAGYFFVATVMPSPYAVALLSFSYLHLILTAAVFHSLRVLVLVTVMAIAIFSVTRRPADESLFAAFAMTGTAILSMGWQQRSLRQCLATALKTAARSHQDEEAARSDERRRISCDVHDGPLQSLSGLQLQLEVVKKLVERDPPRALEEVSRMQELIRTQSADLRAFVHGLRPPEAGGAGVISSVRHLTEGFSREFGIPVAFSSSNIISSPDPRLSFEVLQIVREALHNVRKHAAASQVTVELVGHGGALEVRIRDNGKGFPFEGRFHLDELEAIPLGPVSIRQRVRSLGGDMTLDSIPGQGSSLRIRIPV